MRRARFAGRQPDAGGVDGPLAAAAQTPLPDPYDYDEATPAPKPAKPARWQTVELGKPGHRYKIPVYANRPLGKGELADIKQVVVVIHGVKRDADRYYEYVTDLLERNPSARATHWCWRRVFPVPSIPVSPAWRRGARPAGKKARTACRPPAGAGQLVPGSG